MRIHEENTITLNEVVNYCKEYNMEWEFERYPNHYITMKFRRIT